MNFQPKVGDTLLIEGVRYGVAGHPAAPRVPYGQEGRQAVVYQLVTTAADLPGSGRMPGDRLALKVFKPSYRTPVLVTLAERLETYADLPGLAACRRLVLTPARESQLLRHFPDLTYAVLMPWIEGPTWLDVVLERRALTPEQSLLLARTLADCLAAMEQRGLAHCDLSGPNVLLPGLDKNYAATMGAAVELVDVEQMYGPGLDRPEQLAIGSPGYAAHQASIAPPWGSKTDRFPGAILLAEMLGWCDERVRNSTWSESYFAPEEVQVENKRYAVLRAVLREHWGGGVPELLDRVWNSETLAECPTFGEWQLQIPGPPAANGRPPAARASNGDVTPVALLEAARALEERGDVGAAVEKYRQALAILPAASSLAVEIGHIIANLGAERSQASAIPASAPPGRVRALWRWVGAVALLIAFLSAAVVLRDDRQANEVEGPGLQPSVISPTTEIAGRAADHSATLLAEATLEAQAAIAAASTMAAKEASSAVAARQATQHAHNALALAAATASAQAQATAIVAAQLSAVAQQTVEAVANRTAEAQLTSAIRSAKQTAEAEVWQTATAQALLTLHTIPPPTSTAAPGPADIAADPTFTATAPPLAGGQRATFPGTIAFAMRDRGTEWSLYLMSGTDSRPQRIDGLDRVSGGKINPVFSPDGDRLLFVQEIDESTHNIWLTDRHGNSALQLTNSGYRDIHPCWSTDGSAIVFHSTRTTRTQLGFELWQMNPDGGNQRQVADHGGWCTWWPGDHLVWSARLAPKQPISLYQQPGYTKVHAEVHDDMDLPSWAPGGHRIAYVRGTPANEEKPDSREIYVLDTVTGSNDRLTYNNFGDTNPVWAGDQTLLFISHAQGENQRDIYIMDYVNGSASTPRPLLVTNERKFYLTWHSR